MIFAGTIGASKTVLALCNVDEHGVRVVRTQRYASQELASLDKALDLFLRERDIEALSGACFGVAGPVVDGVARVTNLGWVLDAAPLSKKFGITVSLINDLQATALGSLATRFVIARAMLREPKLIVADEPVSMLDASVRVEILKLMRALQESHGLSVIYITHDLSTVKYFSARIFVMYAGNLIEKAATRTLLDNPLHPYTLALLAATSDPDARNADTFKEVPPGEPPSLVNPPKGCRFHPRCAKAIAGLCDEKEPLDFEPEPNHFVACWLYQ